MNRKTVPAIVAFCLFCLGTAALAGEGVWTAIGPYGGPVMHLAQDDANSIVYADTGCAVGCDGSIYQSSDGGQTWTLYISGFEGAGAALFASQTSKGLVYALGNAPYEYSEAGGYIQLRTVDNQAVVGGNLRSMAVSPDGQTIYMGDLNSGVAVSTDGGTTFSDASNGLPAAGSGTGLAEIQSLAVNPNTPSIAYAFVFGNGIYRTTDGGKTWAAFNSGLPSSTLGPLYVDPNAADTVYFARGSIIYRSVSGANWTTPTSWGSETVYAITSDPGAAGTLYAIANAGVLYKSVDGGDNWVQSGTNIGHAVMYNSITVIDGSSRTILVASDEGVWRTTDEGASWARANDGLAGTVVNDFSQSPTDAKSLLIGTENMSLQVSTDGGATYTAGTNTGFAAGESVLWSPVDPATAYAAMNGYLSVSKDAGQSWSVTSLPADRAIAADPKDINYILAGTDAAGVSVTTDGGNTLATSNQGDMGSSYSVRAVVIDPSDPKTVYAGTWNHGMFKSSDGGVTWHAIGPAGIMVASMAINPGNPSQIYAGTFANGFYRSDDAGSTWTDLKVNVNQNIDPWITGIAFDTERPDITYIASGAGIARTVDGGATWQVLPKDGRPFYGWGTTGPMIVDHADPSHIMVSYWHAGVYEYTAAVDLNVTGGVDASVAPGDKGSMQYLVTNESDLDSADVQVTINVDSNLAVTDIQSTAGSCAMSSSVISCDLGAMAGKASVGVSFSASAKDAGSYDATATATPYEHELTTSDNKAVLTLDVQTPSSGGSGGGGGGSGGGSSSSGSGSGGGGAFGLWMLLGLSGLALRRRS